MATEEAIDTPEVPAPASPGDDWAAQATTTIVDLVDRVRSRTTGPAITVARLVVFSLVLLVLGLVAATTLVIALVRGTQVLLGIGVDHARAVWLSYVTVGGLFTLAGAVLWRVANRKAREPARPGPVPVDAGPRKRRGRRSGR